MKQFEEMGFTPGILKAIQDLGFEEPMPVQEKVIPLMLQDERDIIALAQTGTGKTAAFGLPLVLSTDTELNKIQAIVLCPTRELCMQITGDLEDFAKYTGNLNILAVYGGSSIDNQIRALKKGVHVVVATPGRLIDLIGRKAVKLGDVHTVILDEADEMLNMGFLDSINEILEEVPGQHRTLLFSATMSSEISSIARSYMRDPVEITIGTKNSSSENVSHAYFLVHAKDKYKALKRFADSEPDIYAIVFCRTRVETQEVASKLINDGYNADALHGDLSQGQRDNVMNKFRSGSLRILVATDVAARGLDVDDITHVINYSLPDDCEVYTHRCGRTGRASKTGMSVSLVHLKEKYNLQKIERMLKKSFRLLKVPKGSEICEKQLLNWAGKLQSVPANHAEIDKILSTIEEKVQSLDRAELLRRVVSLEFEKILSDYRNGDEIIDAHADRESSSERSTERRKPKNEKYTRLFLNFGKTDGFNPEQLIELVNIKTPGKKILIGKIDLLKSFSFFEVEQSNAEYLINAFNNVKHDGRKVIMEVAQEKKESSPDKSYRTGKFYGRQNRGDKKPRKEFGRSFSARLN